ncbi:hypothetical protein [Yersinia aldovae]|uniref:N-acetylglucosamine-binding protein A n=2 Tax=Yersinia aldovae TaxID=29483 RepID=A0A0T9SWI4_YERAL|nr:hypothetical protein [Yersinia aldovae]EEP94682.1 hypothetical protein yaldo0001_25050 [Yersinia aldovae ATCC 35236]CNJ28730.1 N-acetylglucosamine-binding protein A [Yersinia aldovae]CNK43444.1 N-acetylglucosamine-binding protein A [Yersinia aldovae]CNK47566.1 N-acetylglucosamine-binding protein A [Yersinia aldovae]
MRKINKTLIAAILIFLMNIQSIPAAKNLLSIPPSHVPQRVQKIDYIHTPESANPPQFEVSNLQYSYRLTNGESYISFTLNSTELVSYYVHVINDENIIYHEVSGFSNHSSKNIALDLENMIAGDYVLVIEVYNNEKVSTRKTYPLIFK